MFAGLTGAHAQSSRTIKFVVPYPPAGTADIVARLLADQIGKAGGPTIVIENRPGAGTSIASEAVSRAAPDGSTLLMISSEFVITPHLHKTNYDPLTSFEPICQLVNSPTVIVVNAESRYRTLADLLDAARAKPGDVTMASTGIFQVAIEQLKRAAKANMTFLPYAGNAAAANALLGNHITSLFAVYPTVAELVKSGKLRAIAAASKQRIVALLETCRPRSRPDIRAMRSRAGPACWRRPRRRARRSRSSPAITRPCCARRRSRRSSTSWISTRLASAAPSSPNFSTTHHEATGRIIRESNSPQ